MDELELYILRIPDFKTKVPSELIDYFAYYLEQISSQVSFTPVQIKACFEKLSLQPYSNISSYLGKNSGKNGKYIKKKDGYILNRQAKERLASDVSEIIESPVSNDLIDLTIFDGTPYYLKSISKEMAHCYDYGYYNATLVLMRKLVETLIIECFERFGISEEIKDQSGTFYYLSDLIPKYLSSSKWNPSRNIKASLGLVKKFGDLSAHNRRYLAKKSDIDSFKVDLRQATQEIILTIDYSNWKKEE